MPDCNVCWAGAGMVKYKRADICVAVAMPGGLITPIIRSADTKCVGDRHRNEASQPSERTKRKLQEYQGGTASMSNIGMYGIKHFTAVINPPQATIMAIGAGENAALCDQ